MPQLDRYLAFSEIFWFSLFFTFAYFIVYYLLVKLIKGAQIRSALTLQTHFETQKLQNESRGLQNVVLPFLEQRLLTLPKLGKLVPKFFAIQKKGIANKIQVSVPLNFTKSSVKPSIFVHFILFTNLTNK